MPARLMIDDEPDEPALMYLWHWFNDLTDWRDVSFGIGALSHQEIDAWARLLRVDISPFEVDVLRQIDRAYRAWRAESDDGPKAPTLVEQMRDMAADAADLKAARAAEAARQKAIANGR